MARITWSVAGMAVVALLLFLPWSLKLMSQESYREESEPSVSLPGKPAADKPAKPVGDSAPAASVEQKLAQVQPPSCPVAPGQFQPLSPPPLAVPPAAAPQPAPGPGPLPPPGTATFPPSTQVPGPTPTPDPLQPLMPTPIPGTVPPPADIAPRSTQVRPPAPPPPAPESKDLYIRIQGTKPAAAGKNTGGPADPLIGGANQGPTPLGPLPLETEPPPPAKIISSSPWNFHLEIVDGKNLITAKVGKTVQFRITCDKVDIQSPFGNIQAQGNVKVSSLSLQASCERLTIQLHEEAIVLEGKVHLTCQQRDSQDMELFSDHFSLRLSGTSVSPTGTSTRGNNRPPILSTRP